MRPEKRIYRVQRNPMTEAAIDPGSTRDLYVSLGEPVDGGALDRARVREALRRLDLGRLPADGARRRTRRHRPRYRATRQAATMAAPAGAPT
jgi:cytochrome c-type biogenesis protein CcmF